MIYKNGSADGLPPYLSGKDTSHGVPHVPGQSGDVAGSTCAVVGGIVADPIGEYSHSFCSPEAFLRLKNNFYLNFLPDIREDDKKVTRSRLMELIIDGVIPGSLADMAYVINRAPFALWFQEKYPQIFGQISATINKNPSQQSATLVPELSDMERSQLLYHAYKIIKTEYNGEGFDATIGCIPDNTLFV